MKELSEAKDYQRETMLSTGHNGEQKELFKYLHINLCLRHKE